MKVFTALLVALIVYSMGSHVITEIQENRAEEQARNEWQEERAKNARPWTSTTNVYVCTPLPQCADWEGDYLDDRYEDAVDRLEP